MIKPADLPETLSLFPLPGALLLPRARLPLHIFEPRYLAMIEDAMKTSHRMIGMIQPLETGADGSQRLHKIGCVGRLINFSETEDGRYMITLAGLSRFRINDVHEGFAPYLKGDVSWAGFERDMGTSETDEGLNRASLMKSLESYFELKDLTTDWDGLKDAAPEMLINSLSMLCPFEPEERQALLESPTLTTRRETLVTLIEFLLRGGDSEGILQ